MAEKELTEDQKKQMMDKLKNMSPDELNELIKKQCLFCKIASGEVKSEVIYEDENVMAILDAQPANPGHVIVFPKQHYSILSQMSDADVARLFALVKYISSAVFEATGAAGTNVIVSSGAAAGQRAPHALVHVIPRFEKDGIAVQFWQPKKIEEKQLKSVGKLIKDALGKVKINSEAPKKEQKEEEVEEKPERVFHMKPRRA